MKNNKKRSFANLASRFFVKIIKDDIFGLSAETAFYLMTAIFPFIIFLFIIVTNVSEQMQNLLLNLIHALPAGAENIILDMLLNFTGSIPIIITSAVFALWSMSNVINTLKKALNRFYGIKETRGYIRMRILCLFFAIIIIVMILLSFALIIFGEGTGFWLRYMNYVKFLTAQDVWDFSRYLTMISVFIISIIAMFKFLPNKKLKLGTVTIGALLSSFAWFITSWAFSFYVNNFSKYHVLYGSLAGIVILTTWVYFSGFVIMLGGELNAFMYKTRIAKRLGNVHRNKKNKHKDA